MTNRVPAEVFPPGEFLRDALEDRGWNQTEFSEIIGRPPRVVNEIIAAKRSVTPETAQEFAAALGTSAQYWLNLESAYQLSKVLPADERIARVAALRERFPVRQMIQRGWIAQSNDNTEVAASVLRFFELKTLDDPIVFSHAARARRVERSELQWAWIFRVKQLAAAFKVPRFSAERLLAAMTDLERLMTEPEEIRHVPKILAECGVRLIVVEPIPGSEIQGVCFWLEGQPVVGLTLKGDYIDRFWFNLRHELEHVLNGDGQDDPITDEFNESSGGERDPCEVAADAAAAEFCVPQAQLNNFVARHDPAYSHLNFLGFSRLMRRHPGIVAGQLQRKINRPELFKKYQVRVRPIIAAAALTDGYGQALPTDI
ncbi:MAG: addiction module antidote protein [Phenylobacterium zucineum]|nr:MAG: addiction module antidote protein [Phenylobacterium zucineum]